MTSALLPEPVETVRWYEDKVRRFGYDHRGLGFRTRSSQERRFEAMLALGDFHCKRLLDVGCGFGDLLAFLHARGVKPLYTGIDICEPMVRRCRERFGNAGEFLVADVLAFEPDAPYDFVVASGIFGLDAQGTRERIQPALARMFGWANVGSATNFLSALAPVRADARVYVDPIQMLKAGLELTPAACLDHTYLPNDFTLHLYRQPPWTAEGREPHEKGL